jgi:hypothetical protein
MKSKGKPEQGPLYHNDYAPRFKENYNIYQKAKEHIKELKKRKQEK